jgi:hypothetical protein
VASTLGSVASTQGFITAGHLPPLSHAGCVTFQRHATDLLGNVARCCVAMSLFHPQRYRPGLLVMPHNNVATSADPRRLNQGSDDFSIASMLPQVWTSAMASSGVPSVHCA